MEIIGIDPSVRSTGLVHLSGSGVFQSSTVLKTNSDILSSVRLVKRGVRSFITEVSSNPVDLLIGMEKPIQTSFSGPILLHIFLSILEVVEDLGVKQVCIPLPVQLRSYMNHILGFTPENKTQVVEAFKALSGVSYRVSQHEGDAYFMARMVLDCSRGNFKYKESKEKVPYHSLSEITGSFSITTTSQIEKVSK